MRHAWWPSVLVTILLAASAAPVSAQPPEEPPHYFFQLGPLSVNPLLGVKDVGIDYNVFNEGGKGQRDFTGTGVAGFDGVLRLGALRATMNTNQSYVWFAHFANQRSLNNSASGKITVTLGLIQPFVAGERRQTRERPGFEIDARARRTESRASSGVLLQITPRTDLVVSALRAEIKFDPGQTFQGVDLSHALNRREEVASGEFRWSVSPISTLTFEGRAQRDRFLSDPLRNANSVRGVAGVEFSPGGLFSGRALAGYKQFNPTGLGQPRFEGVVAQAGLVCSVIEGTKFEVRADRDVEFSYEPAQPYYLSTGGSGQIWQHLSGPVSLIASAGRHRQSYLEIVGVGEPGRADIVDVYAIGLGYTFRERFRLTVTGEQTRRRSNSALGRSYDRTRILTTLDYSFITP